PIATAFLALILLKEKLNAMRWAAVAMSGVSCYLMANVDARQMAYIAAITMSYSFYLITQRKNTYMPRRTNLALQMIVGTALLLTMDPIHTAPIDLPMHFWINVTIIAVVFTVTPLLLNLYALNGMGSSQLAFLIYINPIISFVTAIVWYGEDLNELAVISYSLLAVAILLFNWEIIVKAAEKTGLRTTAKTVSVE
ncbi:MAG TPA: EamA family transporter, partial [bacterium]|nr:EamA family transporter [bacterium]